MSHRKPPASTLAQIVQIRAASRMIEDQQRVLMDMAHAVGMPIQCVTIFSYSDMRVFVRFDCSLRVFVGLDGARNLTSSSTLWERVPEFLEEMREYFNTPAGKLRRATA